jgi:hypothetical protein
MIPACRTWLGADGCKSRLLFAKIAKAIWFQVSGGVIKIAHNMALKNIPYLFLPVCLLPGFRCQRLFSSFLTPDT